jgi:hypothetical protein
VTRLTWSARPVVSGDPEVSPGGGVGRRPVPWLLVSGPVGGVERLRAGRGCLSLEALMTWIGIQAAERLRACPGPVRREWHGRAGARVLRTPGRPGLSLTRSVDELDRNPNMIPGMAWPESLYGIKLLKSKSVRLQFFFQETKQSIQYITNCKRFLSFSSSVSLEVPESLYASRGCLSLEALTSSSVRMFAELMKSLGRADERQIGTSASSAPSQYTEMGPSLRIPNPRVSSFVPTLSHPRSFSPHEKSCRRDRFLAEVIKAESGSC